MKKWMKSFWTFIAAVTFSYITIASGTILAQNINGQQRRENKAFDKSTQITRMPVQMQLPASLAKAVRARPTVKIAAPQAGLATIMTEDFEGDFPTGSWSVTGGFDNLTGKSQVWIAFDFETDAQNNRPDGAFLDDIILQKGNVNAPAVVSSFASPGSSPRGLAFDGTNL